MLGGVAVATIFALLAPLGWPFELFSHFRVQYLASALVLAVLLAWRRRAVPAVLAVVIAVWHALPSLSPSYAVAQAPEAVAVRKAARSLATRIGAMDRYVARLEELGLL